jgi:hypothetical protein
MLIVCTKDQAIRDWAQDPRSGAVHWGTLCLLNPANDPAQATVELGSLIAQLGDTDSLCIHAHGNDNKIGDAGSGNDDWGWSYDTLANLFKKKKPGFKGNVVIRSCGEGIDNFSSRLRLALEGIKTLKGTWIYGQNRSHEIQRPYAKPSNLDKDITLQPAIVSY